LDTEGETGLAPTKLQGKHANIVPALLSSNGGAAETGAIVAVIDCAFKTTVFTVQKSLQRVEQYHRGKAIWDMALFWKVWT